MCVGECVHTRVRVRVRLYTCAYYMRALVLVYVSVPMRASMRACIATHPTPHLHERGHGQEVSKGPGVRKVRGWRLLRLPLGRRLQRVIQR